MQIVTAAVRLACLVKFIYISLNQPRGLSVFFTRWVTRQKLKLAICVSLLLFVAACFSPARYALLKWLYGFWRVIFPIGFYDGSFPERQLSILPCR